MNTSFFISSVRSAIFSVLVWNCGSEQEEDRKAVPETLSTHSLPPPQISLSPPNPHLVQLGAGHVSPLSRPLNQLSLQPLSPSLLPPQTSPSPPNPHLGAGHIGLLPRPLNSSLPPPLVSLSPPDPHLGPPRAGHTGLLPRHPKQLNPQPLSLNLPPP